MRQTCCAASWPGCNPIHADSKGAPLQRQAPCEAIHGCFGGGRMRLEAERAMRHIRHGKQPAERVLKHVMAEGLAQARTGCLTQLPGG